MCALHLFLFFAFDEQQNAVVDEWDEAPKVCCCSFVRSFVGFFFHGIPSVKGH